MLVPATILAVGVLTALGAVVGSRLAHARLRTTRAPTDEERGRLQELSTGESLPVETIQLLESGGSGDVDVSIRGVPGWSALYVSDSLLEALDDQTASALVAAEVARADLHYGLFRAVAVGGTFSLLAATVLGLLPYGLVVLGGYAVVVFGLARRIQYAADARAADRVGADTLADAFETVAERRGVEPETGGWSTLFEVQPPLGDRIERLRSLA